ncbi:hypothetical protein OG589_32905 [Sphaerisporangium sp. NBC_01403]|uniref:hypothetical protein n=1 Tax=Sphaerisporangium sp. NBC_01403 TaxID=2903599 RepID=UPI00324D33D8
MAWLEKASLSLADLQDPRVARTALEAISVTFVDRVRRAVGELPGVNSVGKELS